MDNESRKPIQTFREGAIGASVWKRDGKTGPLYDFTLSRSYRKNDTEAGYTQCFREYNEQALIKVVRQAGAFIRELDEEEEAHAA